MNEAELRRRLPDYQFYHTIELAPGLFTSGWEGCLESVQMTMAVWKGLDFRGKRVLDIGCRDGLFCFEAERRGAVEIIGVDNDISRGAVDLLIPFLRSKVQMVEANALYLTPEEFGKFDIILFAGVLYHLRYPFWALKVIRDLMKDGSQLILETAVLVDNDRHAMLFCPTGNESPYEPSSCTFFNRKGLADTLVSLGLPVEHFEYLHHAEGRCDEYRSPVPEESKPAPSRFEAFCKKYFGLEKPVASPALPVIDRGLFVSRFSPAAINGWVDEYWNDKHLTHTVLKGAWFKDSRFAS
jgi:SAM-dependent methyltransferase